MNPGLNIFQDFVSEVCSDGVLTKRERDFIKEKAETYNIPNEVFEDLINKKLNFHKSFINLTKYQEFYEYCALRILLAFVRVTRIPGILLKNKIWRD